MVIGKIYELSKGCDRDGHTTQDIERPDPPYRIFGSCRKASEKKSELQKKSGHLSKRESLGKVFPKNSPASI
jgi:hypothetical protein